MTELVLCYVVEPWLYFTSQTLDQQWGDDWDDAPYEHNAGEPYGDEGVTIVRVAYEGLDAVTPCHRRGVLPNSPWSVQDINGTGFHGIAIQVGTGAAELSLDQTKFLIEQLDKLVDLVRWDEAIAKGHGR